MKSNVNRVNKVTNRTVWPASLCEVPHRVRAFELRSGQFRGFAMEQFGEFEKEEVTVDAEGLSGRDGVRCGWRTTPTCL